MYLYKTTLVQNLSTQAGDSILIANTQETGLE